jgi:hypothetical protein
MDTTLNISANLANRIVGAASDLAVPLPVIVRSVIRRMIRRRPSRVILFERVKNQRLQAGERWRRIHVSVSDNIYEQCMDMRKIWKRSVSAVFASAVEDFLPEIIQEILMRREGDNSGSYYIRYEKNTRDEYVIVIESRQKTSSG